MEHKERDIEMLLYSRPDLISPLWFGGHGISRWLARQYNVPSGRIDLLGVVDFHDYKSLVVVELKRGEIDSRAIGQVCRYAADVRHILDAVCSKSGGILATGDSHIFKVLIGGSINRQAFLEAEGVGAICLGYTLDDGLISIGSFELADNRRWETYGRLAEAKPFEYWLRQAKIEIEYMERGWQ